MTTEAKQSEQLRERIESRLDDMVVEIAKELKSCFERRRKQTIYGKAPYFHLMADMGLVKDYDPVEIDFLFGNSYEAKPKARELYDNLVAEGFYDRKEFLTF